MNKTLIHIMARGALCAVVALLTPHSNASPAADPSPRLVEQSVDWHHQAIAMQLNFPQSVTINVWDKPIIRAEARVVLRNDRADISKDFRWVVDGEQDRLQLTADFGSRIGNTVVLQNGSDVSNGIGDNATLSGTDLIVTVPAGAKLDISSYSGSMRIAHPGNTLLVNNNGSVEITVSKGIDLTFNSMLGSLSLDPALAVKGLNLDAAALKNYHPRAGSLEIGGGGIETSVTTVVGDISLIAKPGKDKGLSQQQYLEDFDQTIHFIDQFAVHADLNARRLGINYPAEFQRLRAQITPDTDLCTFNSLLNKALNLVQDPHASTMSYSYFSQYGQYQKKYNFDDKQSYAALQKLEAECPEQSPNLDLPILFDNGMYRFFADIDYQGITIPRGTGIVLYQGSPIETFISQHPDRVSPIRVSAADGRRYNTRFYRYGDPQFRLTLDDGREIAMDLAETAEWKTPMQRKVSYGSQTRYRVMYFDKEKVLYVGIPMMDESLVAGINKDVDAVAGRKVPIDKIVIDIRGNPGGSDATWHGVISHLLKRELKVPLDMRFKDNPATRAHYGAEPSIRGEAIALLDQQRYWRHPNHGMTLEPDPQAINFKGKIYLLQDEFIYSSASNFSNFAQLEDQVVSIGATTDFVGGAQIEPLFFKLDHSELFFRLEPVLDFLHVEALPDFAHNSVEMPFASGVEDYFVRSTFAGDIYGPEFLREHDRLFQHVVRL
jgi:hypothetical protein